MKQQDGETCLVHGVSRRLNRRTEKKKGKYEHYLGDIEMTFHIQGGAKMLSMILKIYSALNFLISSYIPKV